MRFRLSTVFLFVLVCAVSVAWYVDRNLRNQRYIIGTWYYPTNDVGVLGYTSLLEIRSDGTFTKIQGSRHGSKTFNGTHTVRENGRITFHVSSKTERWDLDDVFGREPKETQVNASYPCRCAIDPTGYLVIDIQDRFVDDEEDIGIRWETCARDTDYVIRGRKTPPSNTVTRKNAK